MLHHIVLLLTPNKLCWKRGVQDLGVIFALWCNFFLLLGICCIIVRGSNNVHLSCGRISLMKKNPGCNNGYSRLHCKRRKILQKSQITNITKSCGLRPLPADSQCVFSMFLVL